MCLYINRSRHREVTSNNNNMFDPDSYTVNPFIADRPLVIIKRAKRHEYIDNQISFDGSKGYCVNTVRKVEYTSPYMGSIIPLKRLMSTRMGVTNSYGSVYDLPKSIVKQGFHGFLSNATPKMWEGLMTLNRSNVVTLYGVIPVGGKYYIGHDSQVVSDSIMYFETIDDICEHFGIESLDEPHRGKYNEG